MSNPTCPCCSAPASAPLYEVRNVPVHSVTVLRTPEDARAITTGDIALSLCEHCGFVFNAAFDGAKQDYFHDYVSTQAMSPVFNSFHKRLALDLIDRHGLHGRDVVEIGCGQGEFLELLCTLANNRGTGFDPAYEPGRALPDGRTHHQGCLFQASPRSGRRLHRLQDDARAYRRSRRVRDRRARGGGRRCETYRVLPGAGCRPCAGREWLLGHLLRALLVFLRQHAGLPVCPRRLRGHQAALRL